MDTMTYIYIFVYIHIYIYLYIHIYIYSFCSSWFFECLKISDFTSKDYRMRITSPQKCLVETKKGGGNSPGSLAPHLHDFAFIKNGAIF